MKHFKQIDGLRFVAISCVLIEHFAISIGRQFSAGFYGVDLFFVISGFLITNILFSSTQPFSSAYKNFLGRRTLRIFPIYYLTILGLYLLKSQSVLDYFWYYVTYTFNYAYKKYDILSAPVHFWSLCVEEQFYLFFPFIVLGLRKKVKLLKAILLVIVAVCGFQHYYSIVPSLEKYNTVLIFPQAYSLAIGAFGAILFAEKKLPLSIINNKYVEIFSLILLIFVLHKNTELMRVVAPFISLLFVLKTTQNGFQFQAINSLLNNKKVIYIGTISYGIYVYHFSIGGYITNHLYDEYFWNKINFKSWGKLSALQYHSWIIKLPVYSAISIAVAHFSYKYIETPILKLKDKYFAKDMVKNS